MRTSPIHHTHSKHPSTSINSLRTLGKIEALIGRFPGQVAAVSLLSPKYDGEGDEEGVEAAVARVEVSDYQWMGMCVSASSRGSRRGDG